jgi:putative transposase
LEQEAQQLTGASKYERSAERQGYRSGHYDRNLTITSGDVELKMPKLKGVTFETAIILAYPFAACRTSLKRCGAARYRHPSSAS